MTEKTYLIMGEKTFYGRKATLLCILLISAVASPFIFFFLVLLKLFTGG